MIFHNKAISLIEDVQTGDIDIELLCDAIEYLAIEYRDQYMGKISYDEVNNICSKKYKRPFDVIYNTEKCINCYPREYKVKYGEGYIGRPTEVPLNLHLRVGNDADNILRIYFFFDDKEKLIVIGSLPKHLKTCE